MNTGTKVTTGATATTHNIDTGLPHVAFCRVRDVDPHESHHRQLGVSADTRLYTEDQVRAAIEADRKRKGEVVVTKTPDGEIIAVTRQDEEGRILSVIAAAESKRRGEPVAWLYEGELPDNYPYDTMFPYSKVDGVRMFPVYAPQPAEPVTCFKCGHPTHRGECVNVVPQPAEPVKVPPATAYCQHPHCQTTGGCQGPCSKKPAEPTPAQIRRARLRADPVKAAALDRAKERIAAELANSADPVKGPSDSEIMFEWSQTPNTGDMRVDLIAFARALLARYG